MEEELIRIKNNAISLILEAKSQKELEDLKLQFLGRSGHLTQLSKNMKHVPDEKKVEVGRLFNQTKQILEDTIDQATKSLKTQHKKAQKINLDVTDPAILPPLGNLHPVTQVIEEISNIFERIGFTRERYPEIDYDWFAFEALNFPENHPARDDWETFFIKQTPDPKYGPVILTPHTSNGQIREMLSKQLPIKMLNIAKCYRRQSDVSHTPMFHQFETLVVGKDISIVDLRGTLDYFVKSYFGENRKTRIRPYHFQFTEPSFEVDISCGVCDGQGCKLCKAGWLELGGAGMVHPNVLKACNIDPEKYSGFASGFGIERVLMMREGIEIDDLRTLYANRLEFLEQF
ncbi:MAG TPA: phenylalanine--tRNA ligase subunit alpha [Patescibacteria group bacterium]|nr:phenylalanine--tRNA ligase subunit alpha [Patescibacteria group bacterium]